MGTIWVKEFTGGLDTRRLPETTPGGVLVRATDGHITKGGEFEKRAAFVPLYTLPPGTLGLARDRVGLIVFGSAAAPSGIPGGVRYQRLQHPGGATLTAVLSHDLYDGKVYAVGQFSDGSVYHFYDGAVVTDWFDGRARAALTVTGGTAADEMTNLTVGGVSVFTAPVPWATSNADTAAAIAAEINSNVSTPEYTATAVGATVNIIATVQGTAANGLTVAAVLTGAFAVSPASGLVMDQGGTTGGTQATSSFRVTTNVPGATVQISVNGVAIMAAPVTFLANATATAAALAAAINAHTSSPDYTAASVGDKVTITTVDNTDAVNTLSPTFVFTGLPPTPGTKASGRFTIAGVTILTTKTSDSDPVELTSSLWPYVNGVPLTAAPVTANSVPAGTGTLAQRFATAIAAAITAYATLPEYTATASGSTVTVTAGLDGTAANGRTLSFSIAGVVTTSGVTAFSGGTDAAEAGSAFSEVIAFSGGGPDDAFIPGTFVRTVRSKIYSTAGGILHFSGISAPTLWTTDAPGAGFINMATQNSGSEQLTAVAPYQNLLAIFSPEVVQIWFIDPDPNLNTQSQLLGNTGTDCPLSVTQFGDSDVFYLDDSGLRSLRARDSSNAASTTDIGTPIDDVLSAKLRTLTDDEKRRVTGLINPVDKRFWLVIKDEVYVFSFFQNAKVSAWSTYTTTYRDADSTVSFIAENAIIHAQRPYVRSGDVIFAYGGAGPDIIYDETQAEAWLPYLDGNRPTAPKTWTGVDVAATGEWEVRAAMQPIDLAASEVIARVHQTTYNMQRVPLQGSSSHISLRLKSQGEGPAILSALAILFDGDEDET